MIAIRFPGSAISLFPGQDFLQAHLESCAITGCLNKAHELNTAFLARHKQRCLGTLTTVSLSYSSTTTEGGDSASSLSSPCNTKSLNSSIWFQVGERVWEMTWKAGQREKQKIVQLGGWGSEVHSTDTDGGQREHILVIISHSFNIQVTM